MRKQTQLDQDKLALYQIAIKRVKEAGYPLTRDRIWDQYVSIAMRSGMRGLVDRHWIEDYLDELGVEVAK